MARPPIDLGPEPGAEEFAALREVKRGKHVGKHMENRLENLGLIEQADGAAKLTAVGELWVAAKP
ncbi:MAG TPA: hypothetical protein VMU31_09840 [Rhizomicrobium sp.]|nr:hypothetical protein [Rhizomicrobium sp.]